MIALLWFGWQSLFSRGRSKWLLAALRNGRALQFSHVACNCIHLHLAGQDYCAPKTNYAEVRKRVRYAFSEKANEIADAIAVVQSLSAEGSKLLEEIDAQCG